MYHPQGDHLGITAPSRAAHSQSSVDEDSSPQSTLTPGLVHCSGSMNKRPFKTSVLCLVTQSCLTL